MTQSPPLEMRPANDSDVDSAVEMLGEAFSNDALIRYFFPDFPAVLGSAHLFFSILLRARLAMGMPVIVAQQGSRIAGLAMGYDVSRLDWPETQAQSWRGLEAITPGLSERFAAYDAISETGQPATPHYYLGVIGVHPSLHRQGIGKALLDAFRDMSRADRRSSGVYLETANPQSLRFYLGQGFELRGEGRLRNVPVWCLFQRS